MNSGEGANHYEDDLQPGRKEASNMKFDSCSSV